MSREQKSTFVVDNGILTIIVIAAVLLSLVFSAGLFLVQVAAEAKRARDEAAKNKARRLRYRKDDKEVPAPEVEEGGYHTFLSHVWGTGQDQSNPCRASNYGPALCFFAPLTRAAFEPLCGQCASSSKGCSR